MALGLETLAFLLPSWKTADGLIGFAASLERDEVPWTVSGFLVVPCKLLEIGLDLFQFLPAWVTSNLGLMQFLRRAGFLEIRVVFVLPGKLSKHSGLVPALTSSAKLARIDFGKYFVVYPQNFEVFEIPL